MIISLKKLQIYFAVTFDFHRVVCLWFCAGDEYRALVDKYANVRNDFENKMTESCQVITLNQNMTKNLFKIFEIFLLYII